MGLKRNLTAVEIVEQVVFARLLFSGEVGCIRIVVSWHVCYIVLDNFGISIRNDTYKTQSNSMVTR